MRSSETAYFPIKKFKVGNVLLIITDSKLTYHGTIIYYTLVCYTGIVLF